MFPNYQGPFIRAPRDVAAPARELVVGQWSLIPWFAKERKLKYPTSNACSEELMAKLAIPEASRDDVAESWANKAPSLWHADLAW